MKRKKIDPAEVRQKIKELTQLTLQEALEAELEEFLGYGKYERSDSDNSRNGYSSKTVKTDIGEVQINTPRDRNGEFQPQIIPKRKTMIDDLESKIIALYSKGMSTRDIQEVLSDMYGMNIDPSLISRVTDRIYPKILEWQNRSLERIYPVIFIDSIFYKIKHEGKVTQRAVNISEAILMLMFDHLNLNYKYEEKVEFNGKSVLPDFYFPERKIYWEHLGLLDDPYYLEKWKNKKEIYENARINENAGINVLSLEEWNGEPNCCIYTTEEDIKNLSNLWNKLNEKFGINRRN